MTIDLFDMHMEIPIKCHHEIEESEREDRRIKELGERRRQETLLKNSGLTGAMNDMTIANFKAREGTEKALGFIKEYLANWPDMRREGTGFVLIGGYGNGKSHMAAAVVHELLAKGIPASFQPVAELLKRIKATFDDSGRETEHGITELMQHMECLVLDDIGSQRMTHWAQEYLFTLVDYRYRNKLPMIITTNCSAVDGEGSLTDAIGGRIVDRLLERCILIKVTATSYRREIAKERGK